MPGVNTTGQPNTADYVLGRGALYFALLDTSTGKPLGFRHLGNCTAFNLSMETETLEHQSSRSGVRSVDREIILSQKCTASITLDENSHQNLALWFSGTSNAAQTNPAGTAQTGEALAAAATSHVGVRYELRDAAGDRLMGITAGDLTVKYNSGASTLSTSEYSVDEKWGIVFITGSSANTYDLTYDYSSATATEPAIDIVDILTEAAVTGFLRFISINAANNDQEEVLDLHSVTLKAEGEMQRIGDEYAAMTLTAAAERNELGYPDSPVGRIYYHANA